MVVSATPKWVLSCTDCGLSKTFGAHEMMMGEWWHHQGKECIAPGAKPPFCGSCGAPHFPKAGGCTVVGDLINRSVGRY